METNTATTANHQPPKTQAMSEPKTAQQINSPQMGMTEADPVIQSYELEIAELRDKAQQLTDLTACLEWASGKLTACYHFGWGEWSAKLHDGPEYRRPTLLAALRTAYENRDKTK